MEIKLFADLPIECEKQVKEIFFESSVKKQFKNQIEKDEFYYKYLGYYQDKYPSLFYCAVNGDKVLGYICGVTNTKNELELIKLNSHLRSFEKMYDDFPAHLHINMHFEARGLGLGSKLLTKFISALQSSEVSGLHILTSPNAKNVDFYKKMVLTFIKNSILRLERYSSWVKHCNLFLTWLILTIMQSFHNVSH